MLLDVNNTEGNHFPPTNSKKRNDDVGNHRERIETEIVDTEYSLTRKDAVSVLLE